VDEVRRKENQGLRAQGDARLVGTRYDWLRNATPWRRRTGGRSPPCATVY
jgi:hypothetical protein